MNTCAPKNHLTMVKKSGQDRPKDAFWEARNFDIGNLHPWQKTEKMTPETRIPTGILGRCAVVFPFFPKE